MLNLKTAAALGLSVLALGGVAASASAATTSTSQATTTRAVDTAGFCTYQVVGAPQDLWVHSGPTASAATGGIPAQ